MRGEKVRKENARERERERENVIRK